MVRNIKWEDPISKIPRAKRAGGMAQALQAGSLRFKPSIAKKRKRQEEEIL
jgi:hypothetical protein